MAKYRKFEYSAGYVGTDTEVIMKFGDNYTEEQIESIFDEWIEDQHSWSADCTIINESEVDNGDIEDEFM